MNYMYITNYNLINGESSYILELPMIGIEKDELKISVDNDILIIKLDKKEKKDVNYLYHGIKQIKCDKLFDFSQLKNVKIKDISSELKNGILYINFPKKEKSYFNIEIN